jgi:hypothetical protein
MIKPEGLGGVDALASPGFLQQFIKRDIVDHGFKINRNAR